MVIDIIEEEKKRENEVIWNSCCLKTDKSAVIYISQMVFSLIVFVFSAFQLVKADGDCDKSSAYFSLISFLLGKLLSSVVH